MAKTFLLLLLLVVGLLVWRLNSRRAKPDEQAPAPPAQRMVRCAECDVHVPENDAVFDDGRHFCSEAHQLAFANRRQPRS